MTLKMRCLVLACTLLGILTAGAEESAAITVKITKRAPIQTLNPAGAPIGVAESTIGASMTFVSINDDKVVLKGPDGTIYMIGANATDYSPPASAAARPNLPVTTNAAPAAVVPSVVAVTASSPTAPVLDKKAMAQKLNDSLGIPFFDGNDFWESSMTDLAGKFPHFHPTTTGDESLYVASRLFSDQTMPIFGCPCHGLAVEGRKDKPIYLTMALQDMANSPETRDFYQPTHDEIIKVNEAVTQSIRHDQQAVSDALSNVLGPPSIRTINRSIENRREIQRWNWENVSFLLSFRAGAYLYMEIMPKTEADRIEAGAAPSRCVGDDELAKRVVQGTNGDVTLNEFPETAEYVGLMGEWQRYLRYMGVPGDAYIISVMAEHDFNEKWRMVVSNNQRTALNEYLSAYHCHVERVQETITVEQVASFIDKGIPLMWTGQLSSVDKRIAMAHADAREKDFDSATYIEQLRKEDREREGDRIFQMPPDVEFNGQPVVGYNKTTQEIALRSGTSAGVSSTYWITIRTAKKTSPKGLRYLSWTGSDN